MYRTSTNLGHVGTQCPTDQVSYSFFHISIKLLQCGKHGQNLPQIRVQHATWHNIFIISDIGGHGPTCYGHCMFHFVNIGIQNYGKYNFLYIQVKMSK